MAEVYGVKPKKFTKAWWPYFWMYYKWHTIAVVFIVVSVLFTVVQCATKERFDLTINYAGSVSYNAETLDALEAALEPSIIDADENGETNIFVQALVFLNTPGNEESDYAVQTKHDLELSDEISYVYIYDKEELDIIMGREHASDTYMNVHDWAEGEIDEDRLAYTSDGIPCAVSIAGSKLMSDIGMNSENLYIAVKNQLSEKGLNEAAHTSAMTVANIIIK